MPAHLTLEHPLRIGDPVALRLAFERFQNDIPESGFSRKKRLVDVIHRLEGMLPVAEHHPALNDTAFCHGLLTGYAVALKLLDQIDKE